MKLCLATLLTVLSLAGCNGKAWYYPYGPAYFDEKQDPTTVSELIGGDRPAFPQSTN